MTFPLLSFRTTTGVVWCDLSILEQEGSLLLTALECVSLSSFILHCRCLEDCRVSSAGYSHCLAHSLQPLTRTLLWEQGNVQSTRCSGKSQLAGGPLGSQLARCDVGCSKSDHWQARRTKKFFAASTYPQQILGQLRLEANIVLLHDFEVEHQSLVSMKN